MSGDYIGFTFNGIHSSELGIIRVSDGSRFNENLLPTMQDKTVQIPGADGTYYFGSYYTQKIIEVPYAFDSLTEEQLARIREVFGDKKIHELIFDEVPYKAYRVKVTGSTQIKYVPFGEGATGRVYKGEGSIQFTAYDPYARSVHKFLCDYKKEVALTEDTYEANTYYIKIDGVYIISNEGFDDSQIYYENYSNIAEWEAASGMLESGNGYDTRNGNKIILYNPGVKESEFILTFSFVDGTIPGGKVSIDANKYLTFSQIQKKGEDDQIRINTKLGLIEGYKDGAKTGNIYNEAITSGLFFYIPQTKEIQSPPQITIDSNLSEYFDNLHYDYYYY